MRVIDLHPEDLLDKEIRGELSGAERERLDEHLARCSVCRLERSMRGDFAAELSAETHPSALLGLVQGALAAAPAPPPAPETSVETPEIELAPAPREERGRRRRGRVAVLWPFAAALLVAGVASAAGVAQPVWSRLRSTLDPAPAPAVETSAPVVLPVVVRGHTTPVEAAPELPAAVVPSVRALEPAPVAVAIPVSREGVAPSVATPSPPRLASQAFDTANEARRRGDVAAALAAYRALQARYGNSPEAQLSRATMGRLLLDRGDCREALTSFDGYLARGGGGLREEALAGRAEALERLGRRHEETSAWEKLLLEYPTSAYAPHAHRRLEASADR